MKKILIINTGGTIAMNADLTTGKVSPVSDNPLSREAHVFSHFADLTVENMMNIPSPHVTEKEMDELSRFIQKRATSFDGIVITHGTDTLEETAYFLDLTLDVSIPVVVTGAMRSINEMGSDGLSNLRSAIIVARDDASRHKGVLVVMNEEIHAAKYVTKTHTTNLATFQTPTFGPIGLLSKNQVLYFQKMLHRDHFTLHALDQRVALLKMYAGMTPDLIDAVGALGFSGLVIEGLGAGNVPLQVAPAVMRLIEQGVAVVMVSRAFNGITEDVYDYEGGGKRLKQAGVIFTQGMSGVKARIKLFALLNSDTPHNLSDAFDC
ncbi:asparaginase [Atopobacter phocae]|uniref:asparaginase n=1 Tax=Atopobacter phocae TaxID=136492 RepID=UPI000472F372|nr:asparaginase [Atopobacter phocae]